jgi:7-dehydrocholesterol reductase
VITVFTPVFPSIFAACTAGRTDLLVYYLPVFTTLMLLVRCSQQNNRNQKKLGAAWTNYCKRVPSNLIPKVF